MKDILTEMTKIKPESTCKGRVYRADISHCRTKRGFGLFMRFNEVKRLSCPGCDDNSCCVGWEDEELDEISWEHWSIIDIEKAEHGKLYRLVQCNMSRDWETGIIDDWDLKLVDVE